jgi:putative salt-induced outer membrane protein
VLRTATPFLICLLFALPARVLAQAAAPPPPPPPVHEATGELAFVGTRGNTSTSAFSVNGEDIARPTNWLIRNRVLFIRNESNGVVTAQSFLYGLRTERVLNPKVSAFGEYGYFTDKFSGVTSRNTIAGGLSFKMVNTATQSLATDVSLGYMNEQRLTGSDISSGTYGFGGTYQWKFSPTATLDEDAHLVGAFDRSDDWRIGQLLSVTAQLTSIFSLKVSYLVRYNNFPAPSFKRTDTTTSVAFVAKFKRP